jgi:hypothetical protein
MIYRFNAAGTDQLNGMANTGVVLALRALANSGATFSTATTCEDVPGTGPFDKFEGVPALYIMGAWVPRALETVLIPAFMIDEYREWTKYGTDGKLRKYVLMASDMYERCSDIVDDVLSSHDAVDGALVHAAEYFNDYEGTCRMNVNVIDRDTWKELLTCKWDGQSLSKWEDQSQYLF